jgi:hypothetical protein
MAKAYVSEYTLDQIMFEGGVPLAQEPALVPCTGAIDFTSGHAESATFNPKTGYIFISLDATCSYAVGTSPVATTSNQRLQGPELYMRVRPGDKISFVSNT